jgi:hypothetical protein
LLFNSPEFNTPLLCSLDEKLFGVRESIVKVQQVVLREAETIGCTLNRRFVALTSSEVFQNLIVAEIVGRVDPEVLILVFEV